MTKIVITGKDGIDRNMEAELGPIMDRMFERAQRHYHEQLAAMPVFYGTRYHSAPDWGGEILDAEPVQTVGGIKWRVGP